MSTQVTIITHADFVSINLNVGEPDVKEIGARMEKMNTEARMNGFNWDAFIDRYLAMTYPEMRRDLERDPEEDAYVALYPNNTAGNKKADTLAAILNKLIANPDRIYAYMEEDGDGVEWID